MTGIPTGDAYAGLLHLASSRRSIRGYRKDRDVPDAVVNQILELARWAPSGANAQPWEIIVIRDPETKRQIVDLFLRQQVEKREMERVVRGHQRMTGAGFANAPVFILVCGDPRVEEAYPVRTKLDKGYRHLITGLANVTLLIQLAATSLGLGTQYVSDAGSPYFGTMLKALLGIPDPLFPYELIPLGYPVKVPAAPPRRTVDEFTHWDRFDMDKFRDHTAMAEFFRSQSRVGAAGRQR